VKRLLVLRHAKAERDSATGRDFDRPLSRRGWNDAADVGRAMSDRRLRPDAIIASPAQRVVETLAALADGYGSVEPVYDQRIYNASPETLLDVVRQADDRARTLLLVGHNPGLQLLLLDLTRDDDRGLRARIEESFPTAALAAVDIASSSWADAEKASGGLADLIFR
jgi:phosphohistidine phosphatase